MGGDRGDERGVSLRLQLTCAGGLAVRALSAMSPPAAAQDAGVCAALAQPGQFDNTTVSSARMVSDAAAKVPAYCEVTAMVSPVLRSRIGVVFRLPSAWNGKLLGFGGGGWAGNVRL